MPGPKVSIVTPSFNQGPYVERTVRSVLCQDYPDIEYIVMDGGSTDGTVKVLRKYEAALDVLVIGPDAGQSDALNRGFRLARGDILAYLNADDCLAAASTVSRVVARFAQDPGADVIYGRRYQINEHGRLQRLDPYRPFDRERLYVVDYIPQEAAFWTRRIYEAAGGYVDTTCQFAMDYELWLRFLRAGAHFLAVPDYWGLFRVHATQKTQLQWQTVGLRECDRLHREHLGRPVSGEEMTDSYLEHMTGAHPRSEPASHQRFERCWRLLMELHREALGDHCLDSWVDHTPVNPARARIAKRPPTERAA